MATTTEPTTERQMPRPITTGLRHAYLPSNRHVALCGYCGPSTFKNEADVPPNVCAICVARLSEYWDFENRKWL